jgi:hypothetical protein
MFSDSREVFYRLLARTALPSNDYDRSRETRSGKVADNACQQALLQLGRHTPVGIEVRKGVNNRQGRTDLLSLKQILQVAKSCFGGDPDH